MQRAVIIVPYIGIYRLMDATFNNACTKELVVQTVAMISAAVTLRFVLFGCSGVAAHKGAYFFAGDRHFFWGTFQYRNNS